MIEYKDFSFAAPPRSGSTWFIKAASEIGLGDKQKATLHIPPPNSFNGFVVSMVRHPVFWLESYYYALRGGSVSVPSVDVFAPYAKEAKEFDIFVRQYLQNIPGSVGKMFDSYQAITVLKLEDLPWAAIEFFESIGVTTKSTAKLITYPPQNCRKRMSAPIDKFLRKEIVDAEKDFCSRYEYT